MSPEFPARRLARLGFEQARHRDAGGAPVVPAEFVAEQGLHVRIIDVRDAPELSGPLGHIPAVSAVPMGALGTVPQILDPATLLVVVSGHGQRATVAARYLESLGMTHVAALTGGMAAWKALGYSTPRDEDSVRWTLRRLAEGVGRDGRPLADADCALTAERVAAHVGDPGAVRWVKLAAFLLHGKRSCVDGRDDKGVIGTPGGDMGELLLALTALEALRGPLDDATVERVFAAHLDTFGQFYMHTDMHAANALIVDGLRKDPRFDAAIAHVWEPHAWRAWFAAPPEALRAPLLEHLLTPRHIGCGHLRLAMTEADYEVRPALARTLLRAFFLARWSGAPEVEWVMLGGDHEEAGVLEIVLDGGLRSFTRVPLVSPQVDGRQVFVNHPQVTAYLRREAAGFLVRLGLLPPEQEQALADEIERRGAAQLGATLARLAAGLPVFRVAFGADDAAVPTVQALGQVG